MQGNNTGGRKIRLGKGKAQEIGVYVAFVLLFALFSITLRNVGAGFIHIGNLMNILRQTCLIAILSVGMSFVLACAQIDLSIGATVGLVSLVAAIFIRDFGVWQGIAAGLMVGVIIGSINGVLIAYVKIPAMVATLGTLTVVKGVGRTLTQLKAVPIQSEFFNNAFGGGAVGILPTSFLWLVAIILAGWLLMNKMKFGRKVLACGGNRNAARYSGINVKRITFAVMVISSLLAAVVGLLWAGRFAGGRYSLGDGIETSVIAATVLGGTSITGGRASVLGAAIGAIMVGMIDNALVLYGLDVHQQMIVSGIVIIGAVALTTRRD